MATRSKKQTQGKQQKHAQRPKKRWVFTIGIIILVVVLSFALYWITIGGSMNAQAKMARYLEDKYGKEFVVENYRIEGAGIGVEGDPTADAHPSDNTSLSFKVWDRGKYKINQHSYSDNYINAVWSEEQTEVLSDDLKQIFGYIPEYKVIIGYGGQLDSYYTIPEFNDAIIKYPQDISVELQVNDRYTEGEQGPELTDRLWGSISLLRRTGAGFLCLRYCEEGDSKCVLITNEDISGIHSREELTRFIQERN